MPNIRIMNWNIEKLSGSKTAIPGMVNNIARIIFDSQADIVIILELTSGSGPAALALVSAATNGLAAAAGMAHANDYTGWFISNPTGGDIYGVLIRDLNVVRPLEAVPGAGAPTGTQADPLNNLDLNDFATWPGPFVGGGAVANAYPVAAPGMRPRMPLTDVYSSPPRVRHAKKKRRFAGRSLADGGYAVGMGFRMPCLAMFEILNNAGNATYIVPILACHLGAVRGGANPLARGQVMQYKETHIAQKFQNPPALAMPFDSYIQLNNAAVSIRNLIITGDFNVNFRHQAPPRPANALRTGNRAAFNTLTPTSFQGGSLGPAALPPGPAGPVPMVPFVGVGNPDGPDRTTIPNLALKTAVTEQGTILKTYTAGVVPANVAALRGACFDNFFFGGTQVSPTFQTLTLGPPADACQVIDLAAQIVQAGGGGVGALDVSAIQGYHAGRMAWAIAHAMPPAHPAPPPPHYRYAYLAPNLAVGAAAVVLTTNDRLIGARFISDHLPTVVQFNLP